MEKLEDRTLAGWSLFLNYEMENKNTRYTDTTLYLFSPDYMISLNRAGITYPNIRGQCVLNGTFKDSPLVKLKALDFIFVLAVIIPHCWGDEDCITSIYDFEVRRNPERIMDSACCLKLEYQSKGLTGGVLGLRDSIAGLIKSGNLEELIKSKNV